MLRYEGFEEFNITHVGTLSRESLCLTFLLWLCFKLKRKEKTLHEVTLKRYLLQIVKVIEQASVLNK